MSNNNGSGHQSASQRRIAQLEHQVSILAEMANEFQTFMNHAINTHGEPHPVSGDLTYFIEAEKLRSMEPFRIVRTEVGELDGKKGMLFTLSKLEEKETPRIIACS